MALTATNLGREFGLTAQNMNKLLLKHGLVEGGPSAWFATDLGKPLATAVDFDNGYGGYAHKQWGWITWNDKIIPALKASIAANPDGILPPPAAAVPSAVTGTATNSASTGALSKLVKPETRLVAVAVITVAAAAPVAFDAWNNKAMPAFRRYRARRNQPNAEGEAGAAT